MIKSLVVAFLSFSFTSPVGTIAPTARTALLEGNFFAAETILNTIEMEEPSYPLLPLYRGYIQQSMGHLTQAERLFQSAYGQAVDEKILQEILLAEGINALLDHHPERLDSLIDRARKIPVLSPHLLLLEGVKNYLNENYRESALALRTYKEALKNFEKSAWIDFIAEKHFSLEKIDLYIAHSLIEEGENGLAREILEGLQDDVAAPFLALAYLKEGERSSALEKEAYDKLAAFYFDHSSELPLLAKKRMIFHVQTEILHRKELPLTLLSLLEKWKAEEALEKIADQILVQFFKDKKVRDFSSCPLLTKHLNKKLIASLKEHDPATLISVWEQFSEKGLITPSLKKEISSSLVQEMLRGLSKDDEKLTRTCALLAFWRELEGDPDLLTSLASEFLHHGKLLWLKEGEERKGALAMKMALPLLPPSARAEQERSALRFFENLYMLAEKSNMIGRLLLIHEAMSSLALRFPTPPLGSTVANYLADAAYLFKARNYSSACMHAELILKMDPFNTEALRLFGLSLYHMGEYKRALIALKKLNIPDEYAEKALMLCLAHTNAQAERHLVQVDRVQEMDENDIQSD